MARAAAQQPPRPPARDHDSTRDKLLDAAEELLAERGYAATSVRDITAAAGCNLAAVSYHFGGKDNLYREVFRRRLDELRGQRLAAIGDAGSEGRGLDALLLDFAKAFLAPLHDERVQRPPMRLMLREVVDPHLPAGMFRAELIEPVQRALTDAVLRAAPELSERTARLCVQSFVGQLLHILHVHRLTSPERGDASQPFSHPELVKHVVRFTVAGIEKLREVPR